MTDNPPRDNLFVVRKDQQAVDAILEAYDQWRRQQRWAGILGYGQSLTPQSLLGRMRKKAVKSNDARMTPAQVLTTYDDGFMLHIGAIIRSLPEKPQKVVLAYYCEPSWWTVARKAKRLDMSRASFYRYLEQGRELVGEQIDWDNVLVA